MDKEIFNQFKQIYFYNKMSENENDEFLCEYCESSFHTEKSLNIHISKTHKQNDKICPYCKKVFTTSKNCKLHVTNTCKIKKEEEGKKVINYTQQISNLKQQIEEKEKIEIDLITENERLKQKLKDQEELSKEKRELEKNLSFKEGENQTLKEMVNKQRPYINIYNSGTIQSGNSINNVIQCLPCIKDSEIKISLEKLSSTQLMDEEEGLGRFLSRDYLRERVVATDSSRQTIAWKNENKEIIRDTNSRQLTNKIYNVAKTITPIFNAIVNGYSQNSDCPSAEQIITTNNMLNFIDRIKTNRNKSKKALAKAIVDHIPTIKDIKDLNIEPDFKEFISYIEEWLKSFTSYVFSLKDALKHFISYTKQQNWNRKGWHTTLSELVEAKRKIVIDTHFSYYCNDANHLFEDENHQLLCTILYFCIVEQETYVQLTTAEDKNVDTWADCLLECLKESKVEV